MKTGESKKKENEERARREAAQDVREASFLLKDAAAELLEEGECDMDLINDLEARRRDLCAIVEELENRIEVEK